MDNWDLMESWYLVLPPSRPSASQLAHIRSQIANVNRDLPVAVLGSTPEFRDLLHESGFARIFVLDRNASFYEAMSETRIYRNAETFVNGDWLDTLPTLNKMFAVVLSDLTSGNIPYDDRAQFYEGIDRALLEGGVFFDKVLTHSDRLLSVDALIEKYSALPLNLLHINTFSSEMLFCSELIELSQIVDSTLFYRILDGRIKNERVKTFAKQAKKITPPGCKWWYGRKWVELESDYCPQLTRISEAEDEQSSPYYGYLKFFEFMKGNE
jgi:hypothetical protein